MTSLETKLGDTIRVPTYTFGHETGTRDLVVELFRGCPGVFMSEQHREAGHFAPLCDLYSPGPDSEQRYISNYGNYDTQMIPAWEIVKRAES